MRSSDRITMRVKDDGFNCLIGKSEIQPQDGARLTAGYSK